MPDARRPDAVRRLAEPLNAIVEHTAAAVLLAAVLINFAQVIMRYYANAALPWAEEVMRYSMIWMAMLGGGALVYRQEHVVSSLVPASAPFVLRRAVQVASVLATTAFATLLITAGTAAALANVDQLSPATRLPMVVPYLAVPLGALVMLANVVALIALRLPPPEHGEGDAAAGDVA